MVKEICHKNWDFTLFEVNGEWVLSVVFFGLVDYHRSFEIKSDSFDINDIDSLSQLAEKIRNQPNDYLLYEITPAIT
jgi:hypothetical protein